MLRPSAAAIVTPVASAPVFVATTPVAALIALIAFTVAVRLAASLPAPRVLNEAVVTPLIVTVPVRAAPTMLVPATEVALAVAVTPVPPVALIAAALAFADIAALAVETPSLCESTIVTPLIETLPPVIATALTAELVTDAEKLAPRADVFALAIWSTETVWPESAPTWNCCEVNVPSSSFTPLNAVCEATRSISDTSCETSFWSASRSLWLFDALADCTASSRIRWRLFEISPSAPSAVCAREIASFALRAAWLRPRIWDVKRSVIAIPAASSFALLIRRPDDRR
jgi:hypothetical protein